MTTDCFSGVLERLYLSELCFSSPEKAVDALLYFFDMGKVFFKIFVKIHLFANSRERQHLVPIEFVSGHGVARTIKITLIDFLIPFVTTFSYVSIST